MTSHKLATLIALAALMGACGSDAGIEPLDGVAERTEAVAGFFGIDTASTPLETSEEVPACPDARGVGASVEADGVGRVDVDGLETFVTTHFDDVTEASFFGGLGHPHVLAWIDFADGSTMTIVNSYGASGSVFVLASKCQQPEG